MRLPEPNILKRAKIPGPLSLRLMSKVPEPIENKLNALIELAKNGSRTFLIYGPDSPAKEDFCAKLLSMMMADLKKTGRWLKALDFTGTYGDAPDGAGVIVIYGLSSLSPPQLRCASQAIRSWVGDGRIVILPLAIEGALSEHVGSEIATYLAHFSASTEILSEAPSIIKV